MPCCRARQSNALKVLFMKFQLFTLLKISALALVGFSQFHQTACAHGFQLGDLAIDHPYATPSLPGVKNGAAYLKAIRNTGNAPDRLLSASTAVAGKVELHEMKTEGGVMRMREISAITVPAKGEVRMGPGGDIHLMLIDLKKSLEVGDKFDVVLNFEKAGKTTVVVVVQKPKTDDAASAHKH